MSPVRIHTIIFRCLFCVYSFKWINFYLRLYEHFTGMTRSLLKFYLWLTLASFLLSHLQKRKTEKRKSFEIFTTDLIYRFRALVDKWIQECDGCWKSIHYLYAFTFHHWMCACWIYTNQTVLSLSYCAVSVEFHFFFVSVIFVSTIVETPIYFAHFISRCVCDSPGKLNSSHKFWRPHDPHTFHKFYWNFTATECR